MKVKKKTLGLKGYVICLLTGVIASRTVIENKFYQQIPVSLFLIATESFYQASRL
jgi:hypothetical protein